VRYHRECCWGKLATGTPSFGLLLPLNSGVRPRLMNEKYDGKFYISPLFVRLCQLVAIIPGFFFVLLSLFPQWTLKTFHLYLIFPTISISIVIVIACVLLMIYKALRKRISSNQISVYLLFIFINIAYLAIWFYIIQKG